MWSVYEFWTKKVNTEKSLAKTKKLGSKDWMATDDEKQTSERAKPARNCRLVTDCGTHHTDERKTVTSRSNDKK